MRCWIKGYEIRGKVKTSSVFVKSMALFDKTKTASDKSKASSALFIRLQLCYFSHTPLPLIFPFSKIHKNNRPAKRNGHFIIIISNYLKLI